VRGGETIASEFQRQLGIKPGGTTSDNEITLETVNCLGACAIGPIVVVDGHYFSKVTVQKVKEIIHKAGTGLDRVDIRSDQRIFPVEVSCPRCNHSLMDKSNYIDGYPSIRVTVSFNLKHGWLRLSCLYGSFSVDHEYEIPVDEIVNFFCPHCHAELRSSSSCMECGAPMVPLLVRGGGGMVQICSRRGCRGHMLDLIGVNI
jgi:(2Fe-2S) ferredoxin